ncbi:MAG: transglutaminase-like domain-containing protein [Pseudomonadales bacterium]|nr:transglutaminase-like domain-containing protein [Pseudomonadales bacterium]
MHRVAVIFIGCLLFLATSVILELRQPLASHIAQKMAGENWYRIALNNNHVGYMYNNAYRDLKGRWHFLSTTHFSLENNSPNTISKWLTFAAKPPFALTRASYTNRSSGQHNATTIRATPEGYEASIQRNQQANSVALPWQFDLDTFVAFEQWLSSEAPQAGAQHLTESLDFERLRITRRNYRVVEQNDEGYLVETSAPFAATRTQLNTYFQPQHLSMAGLFDVQATSEADAIALSELRSKTSYLLALDQRLPDHTNLKSLALNLHGAGDYNLPQKYSLTANPVTTKGDGQAHQGETLQFPVSHPDIQALVAQSLSQAKNSGRHPVDTLVTTAYERLAYSEDEPAGAVLTALEKQRGECTDYADLFSTLARAAGYPARNIYGLAYKDGANPAFMFHAWNEVYVDGQWRSVDPTWNQTRVDASHMPLSDAQAARLMQANNTSDIYFEVTAKAYFSAD